MKFEIHLLDGRSHLIAAEEMRRAGETVSFLCDGRAAATYVPRNIIGWRKVPEHGQGHLGRRDDA